jgi:hypothetical protein
MKFLGSMKFLGPLILLVSLVMGCGTTKEEEATQYTPSQYTFKETMVSPIAAGEKPPELIPGSKFTFKKTNIITDEFVTYNWTVKSKIIWLGKIPAYLIDIEQGYILWDTDLNFLASFGRNGQILQTCDPAIQVYNWPIKLNKSWNASYDLADRTKNPSSIHKMSDPVRVIEQTSVKTPAGLWRVYVIERETIGMVEKHYYAPDIGMEAKMEIAMTLENQGGPGAFVVDLIGYDIPGVGSKGIKK